MEQAGLDKLNWEQAVQERDRIRQARAFFARQLGPLPAFAGISVSLVGAFSDKIEHELWLWVALGAFLVMGVVSMLYSRMPAYRQLRAELEGRSPRREGTSPEAWYRAEAKLERKLYGEPRTRNSLRLPLRKLDDDLQVQLDRERTGVFVTQLLFLVVIASLVLAHLGP